MEPAAPEQLQTAVMGRTFAQAERALLADHQQQKINAAAANSLLNAASNAAPSTPASNQALAQKVTTLEKDLLQHRVAARWQEELVAQLERTIEEQRVELEKRQWMITALQRTAATLAAASLSRSEFPTKALNEPYQKGLSEFSENSEVLSEVFQKYPPYPAGGGVPLDGQPLWVGSQPGVPFTQYTGPVSQSYPSGALSRSDLPLPASSHSSKDGSKAAGHEALVSAIDALSGPAPENLAALFPLVKVGHPILLLGNEITRIELSAAGGTRFMVNAHRIWELANLDLEYNTRQFMAKHSCPESFVFAKTSARGHVALSATNVDDVCVLYVDAALLGALIADKNGRLLPLRAGNLTEQQANQERDKLNAELTTMLSKLRQKAEELLPPHRRPSAHDGSQMRADRVAGSAIDALAAFAMEQQSPPRSSAAEPPSGLSASSAQAPLPEVIGAAATVRHKTLQPTPVDEAMQHKIQQRQQYVPRNKSPQLCELIPIPEANFGGGGGMGTGALEGFDKLDGLASKSQIIEVEHAKGLLTISFDAMAVMAAGNIVWNNPAFNALAKSLGDGNIELGMQHLRLHFLQDMQTCPDSGPQSSFQDIRGTSSTMATKCNVWCVSNKAAAAQRQILWVLSGQAPKAPTTNGLVVSDPKLADAHVRVLPLVSKRKRKQVNNEGRPHDQPQNLWQKYGCKALQLQANSSTPVRRAYFKCYIKECLAKLTVDSNPQTGAQLKITSSGIHNHQIILENETAATGTVHAHPGDPSARSLSPASGQLKAEPMIAWPSGPADYKVSAPRLSSGSSELKSVKCTPIPIPPEGLNTAAGPVYSQCEFGRPHVAVTEPLDTGTSLKTV